MFIFTFLTQEAQNDQTVARKQKRYLFIFTHFSIIIRRTQKKTHKHAHETD